VLVAGGYGTGVLRSAELYDPATGTWRRTGSMPFATQGGHTATLLRDGTVLVVAGMDDYGPLAVGQVYVPATGRWRRGNDLRTDRVFATATLLTTGRVLVAGGTTGSPSRSLATAERYG
jgi:N-acetylneuraminic acid mutarotase